MSTHCIPLCMKKINESYQISLNHLIYGYCGIYTQSTENLPVTPPIQYRTQVKLKRAQLRTSLLPCLVPSPRMDDKLMFLSLYGYAWFYIYAMPQQKGCLKMTCSTIHWSKTSLFQASSGPIYYDCTAVEILARLCICAVLS